MLSAESLRQIFGAFKSATDMDPVHKNRRAVRVPHTEKTVIFPIGGDKPGVPVRVQMRDISARGCSLVTKLPILQDTTFILQFDKGGGLMGGILCTVKNCKARGDGYRVGAEFTCVLQDKVVSAETEDTQAQRISESMFG